MERICNYTVLDMEMTGLDPRKDKVTEIGAVRVRNGQVTDTYSCLVNPGRTIPESVVNLTGITNEMAAAGVEMNSAMQGLLDFIGEDLLVGQNLGFDYSFLAQWCVNQRKSLTVSACDTLKLARILLPGDMSKKLENLCAFFGIDRENAHRALDDAIETREIFERLQDMILEREDAGTLLKPRSLHYKAKRQTPATKHQIEKLKAYMTNHNVHEEVDWKNLTRNEASRMQDRFFTIYGR